MPPVTPDVLLREIIFRARGAAGGKFVNRVGALYSAIQQLFDGPITDDDCDFSSIARQADLRHWSAHHPPPDFLLLPIPSRQKAKEALEQIAAQGEGPTKPGSPSHFSSFLRIYHNPDIPDDSFPESDPIISPLDWTATLPVAHNPVVADADTSPNARVSVISDRFARNWCQLFNSLYRHVLTSLSHYLYSTDDSVRLRLASEAAFGMRNGLGRIAKVLVKLPAGSQTSDNAGPPFEIDYDVTMPRGEANRWRLQRDVLLSSSDLILELRTFPLSPEQGKLLDALNDASNAFLRFIEQQIP
jgi:hypothetical protein